MFNRRSRIERGRYRMSAFLLGERRSELMTRGSVMVEVRYIDKYVGYVVLKVASSIKRPL